MMYAADFRKQAREKLGGQWMNGKWATYALITLTHSAIMGLCGVLSYIFIGEIALLLISGPIAFGLAVVSMRVMRMRDIKVVDMFCGFKDTGRTFLLYILISIFTALWSLLFIIPGIIMTYAYSMSYYILADNPTMTANEARKKSIELMRGNKWRLFCLQISFIGWMLLSMLTFGILLFWVAPYMQTAEAAFYEEISKNAGLVPDASSPAAPTESVTSGYAPQGGARNNAANRVACPNCGTVNNGDAKFCITCGKKIDGIKCPNCGALNAEGTKFCTKCGHGMSGVKCPDCGSINNEGTKFCTKCGAKLDGRKCPYCGSYNEDGTNFCIKCGTKLETSKRCPDCGAQNSDGAKFCMKCGKQLNAAPQDPPQDPDTISKTTVSGVCPDCGTHNDVDTKFCINCGKKLR